MSNGERPFVVSEARPFDRHLFETPMPSPIEFEALITAAEVKARGKNPFGIVESGRVTMEGPLLSALVWVDLRPQARSHQHDVS